MAAAQLRGSAAPAGRWPGPPNTRLSRFSLPASSRLPGLPGPIPFYGPAANAASKPFIAMCMKADYTRAPIDPSVAVEITDDKIQEPTTVAPADEETDIDQIVAPQQKCAKIHDFCLGIPFGGFLFSMGLIGFIFWRSPVSLTFGVAPGLAILGLGVLSLKVWRSGKPSLPFIWAQAAIAAAVAWKHCQAYTTTKKLLPWGFYAVLSAAMICFYIYVLLAGGNPPPKAASADS